MRINLASVLVDDQDKALRFYTEVLVRFTRQPTNMGPVTTAVLDDTCGNLIQIAHHGRRRRVELSCCATTSSEMSAGEPTRSSSASGSMEDPGDQPDAVALNTMPQNLGRPRSYTAAQ